MISVGKIKKNKLHLSIIITENFDKSTVFRFLHTIKTFSERYGQKMVKKTKAYDNNSITMLRGADRVRKRPAVIFGSDGLEGCEHSVFEILSNAVDEAKEGYGDLINTTVFRDGTIRIEDFGRGVPLDYNEKEGKYNWELVYCERYAGS